MTDKKKDLRSKLEEVRKPSKKKGRIDGRPRFGEDGSWGAPETDEKPIRKRNDRPLKLYGLMSFAIGFGMLVFWNSSTPESSEAARNALETKVSTGVSAGTILLRDDQNIGEQDYTIQHSFGGDEAKLWIWDYAAEDGDYVQVLVDGLPTSEPFMIRHKPKAMTVPTVGTIQVKGIRDGGEALPMPSAMK